MWKSEGHLLLFVDVFVGIVVILIIFTFLSKIFMLITVHMFSTELYDCCLYIFRSLEIVFGSANQFHPTFPIFFTFLPKLLRATKKVQRAFNIKLRLNLNQSLKKYCPTCFIPQDEVDLSETGVQMPPVSSHILQVWMNSPWGQKACTGWEHKIASCLVSGQCSVVSTAGAAFRKPVSSEILTYYFFELFCFSE